MRKKITALGLFLLAMLGFNANAEEIYTWSIPERGTVESVTEFTLTVSNIEGTFEGGFASANDCALYTADGRMISSFGWNWYYNDEVVDGTISFNLKLDESSCWPDYPVSTKGDYYVRIPEGFFAIDYYYNEEEQKAYFDKSPELKLNFTIEPKQGYVSIDNVSVTPADTKIVQCPDAWVINLDNSDITSAELIGDSPMVYKSSWQQYYLDVEISNDGKTITLFPGDDLKSEFSDFYEGDLRVIIFKDSFKFNGDDTKTNDLIQIYYTIPETARFSEYNTFPEAGKISNANEFVFTLQSCNGATMVVAEQAADKSNVARLELYDTNTNSWQTCIMFDTEIIPSTKDEYGSDTNPSVKLTPNSEYASIVLPEAEYKLVVPYGAYIVTTKGDDWNPSKELETAYFEVFYEIAPAPQVSTTPVWGFEDGSVFESFSETTIYFEGLQDVEFADEYDSSLNPVLYRVNEDGSMKELGTLNAGRMEGWDQILEVVEGSIRIYMNENAFSPFYPIDIDGEYKIVLKKGFLKMEGFNDLVNDASEISFKIQTSTLLKAEYATFTPAPGEITEYPKEVVVTFNNDDIQSLEVGLVSTYVGWDSSTYEEIYEMLPAKADLIMDYGYYAYACGQYEITINPENPKQVILTPDPSSISTDAVLQYGNYYLRIPRGGLVANKDTETECVNSILEFGTYSKVQRYAGEIYNPAPGEVEELSEFKIKYKDEYGNDGWGTLQVGTATPELYVYDVLSGEWKYNTSLVAEVTNDPTMGIDVATVRLPYDPVVAGGKYKVVIPRETFIFEQYGSSVVSDLVEAEYTIVSDIKPYNIEVTPAEGDVPYIDDITFKFTDSWMSGTCVEWDENWNMRKENAAAAIDAEGNVIAYATVSSEYDENWAIYQLINFEPAIRAEGVCQVVVDYDVFDTDWDGQGDSDGFVLNYNIVPGAPVAKVSPADGETVKELVNFTVSFEGATELTIDPTMMVGGAKLYSVAEDDTKELYSDLICSPAGDKTAVLDIMDLSKAMSNGTYVLEIPAGMFTYNGYTNEAITATYTLAAVTYNFTVTEAPFNKLTLTVDNCDELKINSECTEEITLWYMTGGEKQVGSYVVSEPTGTTVELTLAEEVEVQDGDYVVWLPEEFFWVGNDKSKDVKFAIDGVVSVETIGEDANFDIYSVNGMIIKRNANKADLKALDPGVYVVNGEKVLVK